MLVSFSVSCLGLVFASVLISGSFSFGCAFAGLPRSSFGGGVDSGLSELPLACYFAFGLCASAKLFGDFCCFCCLVYFQESVRVWWFCGVVVVLQFQFCPCALNMCIIVLCAEDGIMSYLCLMLYAICNTVCLLFCFCSM